MDMFSGDIGFDGHFNKPFKYDCLANSKKCYKAGDPWPPLQSGLLRLYAMKYCSYCHRVRLVLEYKSIPHDVVFVHLRNKSPDWLRERHPNGVVPILEDNEGRIMYESLICCQFVDDANPQSRLHPFDPWEKARQAMLVSGFDKVASAYSGTVESLNEKTVADAWSKVLSNLERYENEIGTGKYFGGRQPSMLDLVIWPWFERFPALALINSICVISPTRFPRLVAWQANMLKLQAVKNCQIDIDTHAAVIRSFADGKPDYGYGME